MIGSILKLSGFYFAILLLSALGYSYYENAGYIDSIWWAAVTAMTVGYGDMYPQTVEGKIIAFVLMHVTVLIILPLMISYICAAFVEDRNEFTDEEQEEIKSILRRLDLANES